MNKSEQIILMQQGKVSTALWKLGVPTMLGMMISAFYHVVDGFFVSHLGSNPMAGVSVSFPLVLLLMGIGRTFGAGAASYVSRLLGAHQMEKANRVASTALYSGMGVVLVKHFCNSTTYIFKNDIELHKESDNYCMNVACHGCTSHRQILQ